MTNGVRHGLEFLEMRRLVVILVFGFGLFGVSAQQPIIPPEIALLWEQALAQPQDFAVACSPVDTPWESVLYNADSAFPLASVSKLLIYLEYARRMDTGLMSYSDVVSASILDRYNLPRTDRGAHDRFMETYAPGTQVLSLWEVAGDGMIQYSSNAASDYMLDRMAPIDWSWLYTSLGLSSTSPPHSLTMIPLLMNNHRDGQASLDNLDGLSMEQGEEYLNLYVQDEAWRQAEIDYRSARRRSFPPWPVQAAILQRHTAVGSARDFLTVMDAIYGSGLTFSENVKSMTRTALLISTTTMSSTALSWGSIPAGC
jgi:hypothetical protein